MDPHSMVYSGNSDSKDCMMSLCSECKHHSLNVDDFDEDDDHEDESDEQENEQSESSDTDSEDGDTVKYYQWKRGDDGYLTKMRIEADIDKTLNIWQSMVQVLKEHIYTKRKQFQEIRRLTDNLSPDKLLIHLDYSENYKSKHQKEIQIAYFGNKSFS